MLIAKHEGMETKAYLDVGVWAICYGNRSYKGAITTKDDCDNRLKARIKVVSGYVDRIYNREFTHNQKVALISFHYNVRNYNHVLWRANKGYSDLSIANSMRQHNKSEGVALRGLIIRRDEEYHLFLTP